MSGSNRSSKVAAMISDMLHLYEERGLPVPDLYLNRAEIRELWDSVQLSSRPDEYWRMRPYEQVGTYLGVRIFLDNEDTP